MTSSFCFEAGEGLSLQVLWEDGERVFCRYNCESDAVIAVLPAMRYPTPDSLNRLAHEYALKDHLDQAWALQPIKLVHERGRTMLLLKDSGGEPLARLIGRSMEMGRFLRLAIALSVALRQLHERGFVHKDINPAHVLVKEEASQAWLTGFGIASRLARQRQMPTPPEFIVGTLAYMAPEQTGRMNRSIDSRSDLYALGVIFYQMITGSLPYTATDSTEWVHCHIARKPVPPTDRSDSVPATVSALVMKLLAKTAEERYQTAAGLEADLQRCLLEWQTLGRVDPFRLGERDLSDRLLIPERLYGRDEAVASLLAAYDRVADAVGPELVLLAGYSGIGKSSVVRELQRALVPPHGLFASGKFDQYKRDIPYATLTQALGSLIRLLLGRSDTELATWRDALRDALGPNGQLMVSLIPELEPLIGSQPPVPELPPQETQRRFQLVFRRLLGVFARPEHPLALFIDDLQWLDSATLDLLEHLVTEPELRYLLLVGAYRNNEVTPAHPLTQRLAAIRSAGVKVREIVLTPLTLEDVGRLITDALRCAPDRAEPLARLIHEKTGGNPFFTNQFLTALAEEHLLALDRGAGCWAWDLDGIHAKQYTDNVADLVLESMRRLPPETQEALQQLACLGSGAPASTLAIVCARTPEAMQAALWPAVQGGLLLSQEGAYQFLHDRVQEAAYALIPQRERATRHLYTGRLLAAQTRPEKREEAIFEIVSHFNHGAALITSTEERNQIAELNLVAGQRAKQSTAYNSALTYLAAGRALLPEDRWERCGALTFALELRYAECEFLTGALAAAEERLSILSKRAIRLVDLAAVTQLREELFTTIGRSDRAIEVCLNYLRHVGVECSVRPTKEEVQQEYERLWRQIGQRTIDELIDLPAMTDIDWRATMDVLTAVVSAALFTDENLLCLVICRMANLSLEHGNSDGSCIAYVWLGMLLGPHFGDYQSGFRFGKLGFELVEQRGLSRFAARVYLDFGHRVIPWTQPIRKGRSLVVRAFDAANKLGDLTFAAYSRDNLITNLLATGDPLADVQREAEAGLDFARKAHFGLIIDRITTQLRLILTLRGLTPEFTSFNDSHFNESRFERHLEEEPDLAIAACWYWIRKLQARFFGGDHASALTAAMNAERLLWTSPSFFELAEYHFYTALTRAALCDVGPTAERNRHLEAIITHHHRLEEWAENCPANFADRAALVAAEISRLEGRDFDAQRLYEQGIRLARANGFSQNEALANEIAASFYAARGLETISNACLRNARYGYLHWGADGKVRQLDERYPYLREQDRVFGPARTIGAPVEQLDLSTVIKVSQAVSGEMVLEKLLDMLMRTAIEQAGAERGLLILTRTAQPRIVAEAIAGGAVVDLHDRPASAAVLPEVVLRYVLRTKEAVILEDATTQSPFSADPYVVQHQARSILCLPLINQANLIGVLYLENNLSAHVFAPTQIAVLKLVASQAATSLENSRLYADLQEREAKIRRLFDANIIGILIWDFEDHILDANDTFLQMVGYDRDELASGGICWTKLTPEEWQDSDARAMEDLKRFGATQSFEKEYFRRDGSRVPVLLAAATFEGRNQGVAFVLDLTERKRVEAEARENEEKYREMQTELAHVNRVTTMGQLVASIAHEVSQPITALVTNSEAAVRWLERQPPDLDEVRRCLGQVIGGGKRAGDVIGRIRSLIRKTPTRTSSFDINEAILEVIALARSEMVKHNVSLQTRLVSSLPLVEGDRVQLQQVLLNLLINAVEAMSGVGDGTRELLICTSTDASNDMIVSVRDSGPGLEQVEAGRIFDAFYTTKSNGMGMGLSICRLIIEAHGGRIWAVANQPRGAVFEFSLPLSDTRSLNNAGAG